MVPSLIHIRNDYTMRVKVKHGVNMLLVVALLKIRLEYKETLDIP